MSTDVGKRTILNPDGSKPIVDVCRTPKECAQEVRCRFTRYVETFLKSEEVTEEFELIKRDIQSFFEKISLKLGSMEEIWTYNSIDGAKSSAGAMFLLGLSELGIVYAFKVFALAAFPYLAISGLVLSVAAFTLGFAFSQLLQWFVDEREKKVKAIDGEYDNCLKSVRQIVNNQLKNNIGDVLTKMIDKVTVDLLPRRIEALEEMIEKLFKSRKEIIAKRDLHLRIASKIDGMQKNVSKMQKNLQN